MIMFLVDELIQSGYLKTPAIIKAFRTIKRRDFLRPEDNGRGEINAPLSIGYGQTISQPATVAFMLELLQPRLGDKVLDVGAGSGWTCALLSAIIGRTGRVYGLERIPELKEFAQKNISKYNFIKKGIAQIFCSDGYRGLPDQAPFAKIIVAATAEKIPKELLKQLQVGGRIVLPLGRQYEVQDIMVIDKIGKDTYKEKRYPGFAFVPLVKDA